MRNGRKPSFLSQPASPEKGVLPGGEGAADRGHFQVFRPMTAGRRRTNGKSYQIRGMCKLDTASSERTPAHAQIMLLTSERYSFKGLASPS